MPEALKVRGLCAKCGRVVNTTAPKGRATWRGPCPRKGCDGIVLARRVRADDEDQAAAPTDPQDTTAPAAGSPEKRARKPIPRGSYAAGQPAGSGSGGAVVQQPPPPADGSAADGSGGGGADPGKPDPEPDPAGGAVARPVRAQQPETGHTGQRHAYGHLFPGVW